MIEIEFRAVITKKKYNWLGSFLARKGKDLGEDDKNVFFFIMPDKLLKVVDEKSKKKAKVVLKMNKIGKGAKSKDDYNPNKRYPKNIIKYSKYNAECNQVNRVHPTQKPVALCEYLVKTYTNEGETVLDFCFGSGTTGVACKNLNRNFIGIELDETYFEIAKKRIYENY